MDYHFEENWIYWVDFEEDKHNGIYRIHPDGSEKQHIIKVCRVHTNKNVVLALLWVSTKNLGKTPAIVFGRSTEALPSIYSSTCC